MRFRKDWTKIDAALVTTEGATGIELERSSFPSTAPFADDSTVVVCLAPGKPSVQLKVKVVDRVDEQAVVPASEWTRLGSRLKKGTFQVRPLTVTDLVGNLFSNRALVIIAPVLVAFAALGPSVIWRAADASSTEISTRAGFQLVGQLQADQGLDQQVKNQVRSAAAQMAKSDDLSAVSAATNDNNLAELVALIAVLLFALVVALPPLVQTVRGWLS